MSNVIPFPSDVLRILREAAKDTAKFVDTIQYQRNEIWIETVHYLQAIRCLEDGRLVGAPTQDQNGNWRCVLERLCGDQLVRVDVAVDTQTERVYLLRVR